MFEVVLRDGGDINIIDKNISNSDYNVNKDYKKGLTVNYSFT